MRKKVPEPAPNAEVTRQDGGLGYRIWGLSGSVPPSPGSGSALATLSPKGEEVADRAAAPSSPQRGEGGRAERGRMRGQLPICDCPVVRMAGYRILGFIWIRAPSPGSGREARRPRRRALFSPAGRRWPSRARPDEGAVTHMQLPWGSEPLLQASAAATLCAAFWRA